MSYIHRWQCSRSTAPPLLSSAVFLILCEYLSPKFATRFSTIFAVAKKLEQDYTSATLPLDLEYKTVPGFVSYRSLIESEAKRMFNTSRSDVIVHFHIPKTGGSDFEQRLVRDLDIKEPCICRVPRRTPHKVLPNTCKCYRTFLDNGKRRSTEPWLFSGSSVGYACPIHPDWTRFISCVQPAMDKSYGSHKKRRYFYITMIRNPIERFLSDFRHRKRGVFWKMYDRSCKGRRQTAEHLRNCYDGRNFENVTLHQYLDCPHNLAYNLQTRKLSGLPRVNCFTRSDMPALAERDATMLATAKRNLESLAFFGITEQQMVSQYIFEETFGLKFKSQVTQVEDTFAKQTMANAANEELETIRRGNKLDIELYQFAKQLLESRLCELKSRSATSRESKSDLLNK